jgi:transposase
VIDGILGIDVSKNTLDASMSSCNNRVRARSFANSSDGWRHLLDWLTTQKIRRVHACMESTGRYSLGIACALYEVGHIVSIVNPAQIRDFARTKLGRNKTDGVDAAHIREYCELFKPKPWAPPSEAHRRLGELQRPQATAPVLDSTIATYCSAERVWSLTAHSGSRCVVVYCRTRRLYHSGHRRPPSSVLTMP